jgi:virginiamycin B lyase
MMFGTWVAVSGIVLALTGRPEPSCPLRSSDWLALLPEGEEKRSFILDCTGCHQLDSVRSLSNGQPRSAGQWAEATTRMLGYAGANSSFPVISVDREPLSTALWLARHLDRVPPRSCANRELPPGASIREFPIPEPGDLPHDVAIDSAGNVIVTGMFTHRLYLLHPDSAEFSTIPIPVERANPRAIELDREGNWWVVLGGPQKLARYVPSTRAWASFDVGMYPHSLAPDQSGRVWFNGHFTRNPSLFGYVSADGMVTTLQLPLHPELAGKPGGPIPYEIRAAPNGLIWGSELAGNRVFFHDPVRMGTAMFTLPTPISGPRRLDIDRDGVVWIPAYAANALVRLDIRSLGPNRLTPPRWESFPLPIPDAAPYVVRIDSGTGLIWIGTGAADALLSFDPATRKFTVYPLPSAGALIRHLAIDPRSHDVWAGYGASPGIPARIARLRLSPR